MPARPLTEEQKREAIALIEECLREGYAPPDIMTGKQAVKEASLRAVQRGITNSTGAFITRMHIARGQGIDPDWTLYRPAQYQHPKGTRAAPAAPFMGANLDAVQVPSDEIIRIVVIGDTHDDPRLGDYDRFRQLGKMAAKINPDIVVQIGDWSTFDSVSRHEDRSTIHGRALPSFEDDLGSLRMSLRAFNEGLGDWSGSKFETLGNHEDRVRQYENLNATLEGAMYNRVLEAFMQYGWKTRPFGEWLFIGGVGFTHVPLNTMGRPYNGKTLQPIANDAVFSIVFGHSHKGGMVRAGKIGPNRRVTVLNVGCALPDGHVEDYAKLSMTGWEYGLYLIEVAQGDIQSVKHYSMAEVMAA